jgi:hypothetical protein
MTTMVGATEQTTTLPRRDFTALALGALAARPPVIAMLKPILIGWPDCATALSVSTASVPTTAVVATPRLAACKNSRRFMIGPFAQATRTIWPPRRPQK